MKKLLLAILLPVLVAFSSTAQTLTGQEIFKANCKACHSIGEGDVVGPDLAGLIQRRDAEWIKGFITNSQKMVAAGDEAAVEVFNKYNKIAMPSHNFKEEELSNLISYIGEATELARAEAEKTVITEENGSREQKVLAKYDNEPNLLVNLILGFLGLTVGLLAVVAIYLYRLLKM